MVKKILFTIAVVAFLTALSTYLYPYVVYLY